MPDDRDSSRPPSSNSVDGRARDVVQAGEIRGDVNFYSARRTGTSSEAPVVVTSAITDSRYFEVHEPREEAGKLKPVSGHTLMITVESTVDRTVILRDMRVVVVSRVAAPSGVLLQQMGSLAPRSFSVDLDESSPRVEPSNGTPDFPYSVSLDDPEIFSLTAHVTDQEVRWRLEFDWTCAGRSGTTPVDLGGHPVETVPDP